MSWRELGAQVSEEIYIPRKPSGILCPKRHEHAALQNEPVPVFRNGKPVDQSFQPERNKYHVKGLSVFTRQIEQALAHRGGKVYRLLSHSM